MEPKLQGLELRLDELALELRGLERLLAIGAVVVDAPRHARRCRRRSRGAPRRRRPGSPGTSPRSSGIRAGAVDHLPEDVRRGQVDERGRGRAGERGAAARAAAPCPAAAGSRRATAITAGVSAAQMYAVTRLAGERTRTTAAPAAAGARGRAGSAAPRRRTPTPVHTSRIVRAARRSTSAELARTRRPRSPGRAGCGGPLAPGPHDRNPMAFGRRDHETEARPRAAGSP